MNKTQDNAVSSLKHWSVTGWSFTFQLVTLNLMRFGPAPKRKDEDAFHRALCGFPRPSLVTFSDFTARTDAIVQDIHISQHPNGLTSYRFEFKNQSFIEIVAREDAIIRW
jgi:hypothetical protein